MYTIIQKHYSSIIKLAYDNYNFNYDYQKSYWTEFKIVINSLRELCWTLPGFELINIAYRFAKQEDYQGIFLHNYNILSNKFTQINKDNILPGNKVAFYAVSMLDHNGYLFSFAGIMMHLNTVMKLQEAGFTVYPHLVSSKNQIDNILANFQQDNIEIDLILVAAHGEADKIMLNQYDREYLAQFYAENNITNNKFTAELYNMVYDLNQKPNYNFLNKYSDNLKFHTLKKEYDIVFYSCSTAKGNDSFALQVAKQNPHAHVFGATKDVFINDIIFSTDVTKTSHYVDKVQYHPALFGMLPSAEVSEMKEFFAGETYITKKPMLEN